MKTYELLNTISTDSVLVTTDRANGYKLDFDIDDVYEMLGNYDVNRVYALDNDIVIELKENDIKLLNIDNMWNNLY